MSDHAEQVVGYGPVYHYDSPVVPDPYETFLDDVLGLHHIHEPVGIDAHLRIIFSEEGIESVLFSDTGPETFQNRQIFHTSRDQIGLLILIYE